ncbi:MAG: hypothetical protein ABSD30_14105 [Candidatus Binatus sp.]
MTWFKDGTIVESVTGVLTKMRIETSAVVRALLTFIGVAMLLSFPVNKAHRFEAHFRTPEIRRAIARSTFLAQPEVTGAEHIVHAKVAPSVPVVLVTPVFSTPLEDVRVVSEVLPTRFLLRIKPAPRPSGGSDPLS